jgi:hypothetical protein
MQRIIIRFVGSALLALAVTEVTRIVRARRSRKRLEAARARAQALTSGAIGRA